jgi:hypothetical protein
VARVNYPSTLERLLYAAITLFFAICACCNLGACAKKEENKPIVTTWAQICMRNDMPDVRTSDESCDTAPDRFHWLYVFQNDPGYPGCPPVGGQLAAKKPYDGWITTTERPPGVGFIGLVPYNGGLGVVIP